MSLSITKAHEPIAVTSLVTLIYGQPGVGKTSLAFTAQSPLMLDFDRGAYRSQFRKDSVQVDTWADVAGMTQADLNDHATIIVDTVGRLLDSLTAHLINQNPKLAQGSGALTLKGYGELKAAYATWLKTLASWGKDVILIAHDKEDKRGDDDVIVRADIQGGSYGEVFKRADGVAYMYRAAKQTLLDFNPSERWVGKNAGGFDALPMPSFHQSPDYMADLLQQMKDHLNELSEEGIKIMAEVDEWRAVIDDAGDAEAINALVTKVAKVEPPIGPQVKRLLKTRAEALELVYEGKRGSGRYVATERNAA